MQKTSNPISTRLIIVSILWAVSVAIITVPGGVVTQVREANRRFDEAVRASPFHRLCYQCNRPAVEKMEYTDGSVRYFCASHPPPPHMKATDKGDKGQKNFSPTFCIAALSLIYGANCGRLLLRLTWGIELGRLTILGAVAGVGAAVGMWYWFGSRLL